MAHQSTVTGAISELTAARAMMESLGWEVSKPIVPEVYDFLARDPVSNETYRVQCKTLRIRADRNNALVVYGRKNNGKAYTREEIDYFIAIDGDRAFMFECENLLEYWCTETTAKTRWIELTAADKKAVI